MDAHEILSITAECLCRAHAFSTPVPRSQLPLEGNVCHCGSCRHSTGGMCIVETTWPQSKEDVDISALQAYQFSENVTYRFCGICSTLMFYESAKLPKKLGVYTPVLKDIGIELVQMARHIWVTDTLDGGASVWLRKPNEDGLEVPRNHLRDQRLPWDWPGHPPTKPEEPEQGSLPIWCHCRGVQFRLNNGHYSKRRVEDLPAFVDGETRKLMVTFDVGRSGRLHQGSEISNWALAEMANLSQADGGRFPSTAQELMESVESGDPRIGSLACYRSSPGVQHYFCRSCSAAVFYAVDSIPDPMGVAVGVLESSNGARAENFLTWGLKGTDVSGMGDAGPWRAGLAKRVEKEVEAFTTETST